MKTKSSSFLVITSLGLGASLFGQSQFVTDFNSGLPSGASIHGNAAVAPSGGVNNSGVLKLTINANDQFGVFYINDFSGGAPVNNFKALFKAAVGGGSARPADGFSFNFATALPAPAYNSPGEDGAGSGLTVSFDTWDSAGIDTAPAIELRYASNVVAFRSMHGIRDGGRAPAGPVLMDSMGRLVSIETAGPTPALPTNFVDVVIELTNNTVSMSYSNVQVFNAVPISYTPISGGTFGFGGRTGGANENMWFDDLQIFVNFTPGPPTIIQQPQDVTTNESARAVFTVEVDGTPPYTVQWFSNNVAIPGANSLTYTTPPVTPDMSGTVYRAEISNQVNPTPISTMDATLTVTPALVVQEVSSRGKTNKVFVTYNKQPNLGSGGTGYALNNGATVVSQAYDPADANTVELTTDVILTLETTYTLTVSGVTGMDGGMLSPDPTVRQFRHGFGRFCTDFNSGLPVGTAVFGNAMVAGDGILHLTDAVNSQSGAFIIANRTGGFPLDRFTASFRMRLGGGTPTPGGADGLSFNFAPDLPNGTVGAAEEGAGTGLTLAFDIWDNGGGEAPALDVKWAGSTIGHVLMPLERPGFVDVGINLDPDGTLDVRYDGILVYDNLPTPFEPFPNGRFGFYARTGGANANHWIDDLCINDFTVGPVFFTDEPDDVTVGEAQPAAFSAAVDGTPPFFAQWFSNNVAIPGANQLTYTTPPVTAANEGDQYSVQVSNDCSVATSSNATVHVLLNPRVADIFSRKDNEVVIVWTRDVVLESGTYDFSGGFAFGRGYGASHSEVIFTNDVPLTEGEYTMTISGVVDEEFGLPMTPDPTVLTFHHGFGAACFDFSSMGAPAGTLLFGTASIPGDGVLHLTDAANDQQGSFIVEDRNNGFPLDRFQVRYEARVGGGTANPADGYSFNFASNLPSVVFGEEGAGTGLTIAFDNFDNGGGEAPAIDVKWGGQVIAHTLTTVMRSGAEFYDVYINMDPDGTLDLIYNGQVVYWNLQTPFTEITGGRFGFGARTGGLNDNHWIRNLCINNFSLGEVLITQQPADVSVPECTTARFQVDVDGLPPFSAQWFSNDVAIAGADAFVYQTPPLDRNADGARYKVVVSNFFGVVESREAIVTIIRDETPPEVLSAVARCFLEYTNIVVTFSEPLNEATAENAANYTLNFGGTAQSATLRADGRSVELHVTPGMDPVNCNVLTVNSVRDFCTFNEVAADSQVLIHVRTPLLASGAQNLIVVEAEDFDESIVAGGKTWTFSNVNDGTGAFTGAGYMESLPNTGTAVADADLNTARLDYCVRFPAAGTYYLWLRGKGRDGADNSVHAGLDGARSPQGLQIGNDTAAGGWGNNDWRWVNDVAPAGSRPARITVPSAGLHNVNIWVREDGTQLDRILLTTDAAFTFADPTVAGPAPSAREPSGPQLSIRFDGTNVVVEWDTTLCRLQCARELHSDPAENVWEDVASPSPYIVPFEVNLDTAQEVPTPVGGTGSGSGTMTLSGHALTIDITFSGLSGNAMAAHIHGPAPPGTPAGILYDLAGITTFGSTSGTINGTVMLMNNPNGTGFTIAQQLQQLRDGLWYVNIHTSTHGPGEIRGQIVKPPQSFYRLVAP